MSDINYKKSNYLCIQLLANSLQLKLYTFHSMPLENYTYLIILLSSFFFPFVFSFDKRVAFFKKWKKIAFSIILPATFFIIWDIWFMNRGIWSFNDVYIIGIKPLGLPIEEWLFFAVIPYCSLFVYEVVKTYFQRLDYNQLMFWGLILLGLLLLIFAGVFFNRNYTFWCFVLCAIFIAILLFQSWFLEHITHLTFTFAVCLIPMLLVNGVLTLMPVVQYNEAQIIGLRIYTIPLEDFVYYLLLLVMNVLIYERIDRIKE